MNSFNLNLEFDLEKNKSSVIKVIGVGGGGGNAVNYMYSKGIKDVDFVVVNTDSQDLSKSPIPIKIQIGKELTEGLGAGANPEIGEKAAIEDLNAIKSVLEDNTKMIFITAGMGGGTGTGAAPIIAKLAREMGILTVAIVTSPFMYEGKKRNLYAQKGIENLREYVDSLIIINNNKLRDIYGNLTYKEAFAKSDQVLASAATSIAKVITHNFTVNVDFRDVKTVLEESGTAIMGSAASSGEGRAEAVIKKALDSPLLNDNKITGAKNVLLLIVSGKSEITIDEISDIMDYVQDEAGHNADVIMGIGEDPEMQEDIAVTIIATGFNKNQQDMISNTEPDKIVHVISNDGSSEIVQPEHISASTDESENKDEIKIVPQTDAYGNTQFTMDFFDDAQQEYDVQTEPAATEMTEVNEPEITLIQKPEQPVEQAEIEDKIIKKEKETIAQPLLFQVDENPTQTDLDHIEDLTELPFEQALKLRSKRKAYMKSYTTKLPEEVSNEPAFKQKGIDVDLSPKSTQDVSRMEVDNQGNITLKTGNSFLHGAVD